MGIEFLSDESILRFYEEIRQHVSADLATGNRSRFMGEAAKQRAERLREEIDRRRLRCNPIKWETTSSPFNAATAGTVVTMTSTLRRTNSAANSG